MHEILRQRKAGTKSFSKCNDVLSGLCSSTNEFVEEWKCVSVKLRWATELYHCGFLDVDPQQGWVRTSFWISVRSKANLDFGICDLTISDATHPVRWNSLNALFWEHPYKNGGKTTKSAFWTSFWQFVSLHWLFLLHAPAKRKGTASWLCPCTAVAHGTPCRSVCVITCE